jgi:MFS family permease
VLRLIFLKDLHQPPDEAETEIGVNMFKDAFKVVRDSPFSIRRLLFLGGFFMFCFHLDSGMRAVYAIDIGGLSTVQWGWIVSITSIVSSVSALIIGGFIDSYGRKRVFIPAVVILGLSTLIFILSRSYKLFLFARILGGIGLSCRMISLKVIIADSIPDQIRGRVMGIYYIFSSMGSSTALLFSGILYDIAPVVPFYVSVFSYFLATLIAIKFLTEPDITTNRH